MKLLREGPEPPAFDVVLMDLQMPEMDGYTATRLLRADPRFRNLPIIAMTAHALVEERQRCLDAGMNDHVTKPIDPDALFAALRRWAKPREHAAAAPAAKPAAAPDETALPEIEGIDVSDGLKRVAGNKRLYRNLLEQFADKQADAGARIAAALQGGDLELAEPHCAHGKGRGGQPRDRAHPNGRGEDRARHPGERSIGRRPAAGLRFGTQPHGCDHPVASSVVRTPRNPRGSPWTRSFHDNGSGAGPPQDPARGQ